MDDFLCQVNSLEPKSLSHSLHQIALTRCYIVLRALKAIQCHVEVKDKEEALKPFIKISWRSNETLGSSRVSKRQLVRIWEQMDYVNLQKMLVAVHIIGQRHRTSSGNKQGVGPAETRKNRKAAIPLVRNVLEANHERNRPILGQLICLRFPVFFGNALRTFLRLQVLHFMWASPLAQSSPAQQPLPLAPTCSGACQNSSTVRYNNRQL